eukprot:gene167-9792_t
MGQAGPVNGLAPRQTGWLGKRAGSANGSAHGYDLLHVKSELLSHGSDADDAASFYFYMYRLFTYSAQNCNAPANAAELARLPRQLFPHGADCPPT